MLCFEDRQKCLKNLFCCPSEDPTDAGRPEIEIIHDAMDLQGKKIDDLEGTDSNCESDSGVGSVASAPDSGKESMTSKIPLKIAQSTVTCVKTPVKVTRVKSVKRSESLLSRFSFIFPSGGEKLSEILVEEFKKNDRTTGIALERMFSSNSLNSISEEAHKPKIEVKKQLKKKKSLKQLITGKDESRLPKGPKDSKTDAKDSTPDVPTTPEMDLENREKKKRKKRRTQRKNIDADEGESSSSADNGNANGNAKRPVRKPSQKHVDALKHVDAKK